MRKKVFLTVAVILLAIGLTGSGMFGFGLLWNREEANNPPAAKEQTDKRQKLVVAFPGAYGNTSDMKEVNEAINRIVEEKLDLEVEFKVISNQYSNTISKMLAGKEQIDIVNMANQTMYMEAYINGYLYDLEDVLQKDGQGVIDALGMDNINACRINGVLYGLTNNRDYAAGWDAYVLNKEILDKYRIKAEDIETIEDLERIYDLLLEKEPDIIPVEPGYMGTMLSNFPLMDGINGFSIGGHLNYGQEEEVVNILESDEYWERLERVRRWYLKGYLGDYSLLEYYNSRKRLGEGRVFSLPVKGKPGLLQQEIAACGRELVFVQFGENAITYNSLTAAPWTITQNTVSAEKSMQLLNLLYTNADIMNLLCYGIEGKHYVKTEDGHITFPQGKTNNFFVGNAWRMPNQFITYVWQGNPLDLWEQMKEHNKNALQSCEIGFNFDISKVKSEYVAINRIYDRYRRIVENGLVNPREGLRAMLKEMNENGLEDVIQEKRVQFERWKKD